MIIEPEALNCKIPENQKQLQTVSQHQYSVSKNCKEELSSSRDPGKH